MPDDPAIIDAFPTAFNTQEDILTGLNVLARAALFGEIPAMKVDPLRKILETGARTIAMRDTVKQNDKPRTPTPVNMQINTTITNQPSPAQISAIDTFLGDQHMPSAGTIKAIAALDDDPLEVEAAPLPQSDGMNDKVRAGKADMRAGKATWIENLRRPQ